MTECNRILFFLPSMLLSSWMALRVSLGTTVSLLWTCTSPCFQGPLGFRTSLVTVINAGAWEPRQANKSQWEIWSFCWKETVSTGLESTSMRFRAKTSINLILFQWHCLRLHSQPGEGQSVCPVMLMNKFFFLVFVFCLFLLKSFWVCWFPLLLFWLLFYM